MSCPDCGGTAVDGYCDTCGLAVEEAADSGPATAAAGPGTMNTGSWAGSGRTGSSGSVGSRPSRRASGRTGSTRQTDRGRLGAGLLEVPAVAPVDPATALLADPVVAEDKRFCSTCGGPVGRGRDGSPGRTEGFCPKDGTPYSFSPKLAVGDLVGGQYEVQGCLAHGGLGWIYLAIDRNVENRWRVLKGVLDTGDADAMAAAVAEKRFLAQVSHPNIVSIVNFVQHPDDRGKPVDYIVMEYVGGSSLKQLLAARRRPDGTYDPIPTGQAIAYALEALPALGYLHANGLLYCDFKPDNVIQYERQIKLIDLGAVIRADDQTSAVFGTKGYQAPEVATIGPSVFSDIHTVGRTLAVLALGMLPTHRGVPTDLPADHPVLVRHDSFHRLLRRATDPDPLRRFESTAEMQDQLTGVLREVLAAEDGTPRPGSSAVFGPQRATFAPGLLIPARAGLFTDAEPDAGTDIAPGTPRPQQVAAALVAPVVAAEDATLNLRLSLVRARLDANDPDGATAVLDELADDEPDDWRLEWYRGVTALVAGDADAAATAFDTVYSTLPGEAAPKLALAAAAECAGRDEQAGPLYTVLARTDPSLADAAFGRARVALRAGDRAGAAAALDAVPETSSSYRDAQLAAVDVGLVGRTDLAEDELRADADRVQRLQLDPITDNRVRAALLTAAVPLAGKGGAAPFLGHAWRPDTLRAGLEQCLRASARLTSDAAERIALVDHANAVRPRTWT